MNIKEYQQLTVRTCVPPAGLALDAQTRDLLHAAMGLATEAGELQDQLKRNIFYGKPLDIVNIQEELGDALWYIGMVCERLHFSMEKIMEQNIAKLRVRFPEKFTAENALSRDLNQERASLENNSQGANHGK